MNKLFLLSCLLAAVSGLSRPDNPQQKGFAEWIAGLFGPSSTTTLRPTNDPPANCPSCQCGLARTRRRIVGGYETKKLEFPWMALLMYNGRFFCGGSLINDLYVLTAAHCTAGFRKERMSIRFLEHDRSNANETKTIERKVAEVIRHLRYNPATYDNDIALLKLDERMDLSTSVKRFKSDDGDGEDGEDGDGDAEDSYRGLGPVCLPTKGLSYTDSIGIASGWGATSEGGPISDVLQEVGVRIMSNAECRQTNYKNRITDNMMCAGEPEGGKDACQGDSGGPLHVRDPGNGKFEKVGIVSWGEGCARPGVPGVYTRVNRYHTWVKSNTRDACYCS